MFSLPLENLWHQLECESDHVEAWPIDLVLVDYQKMVYSSIGCARQHTHPTQKQTYVLVSNILQWSQYPNDFCSAPKLRELITYCHLIILVNCYYKHKMTRIILIALRLSHYILYSICIRTNSLFRTAFSNSSNYLPTTAH